MPEVLGSFRSVLVDLQLNVHVQLIDPNSVCYS